MAWIPFSYLKQKLFAFFGDPFRFHDKLSLISSQEWAAAASAAGADATISLKNELRINSQSSDIYTCVPDRTFYDLRVLKPVGRRLKTA